MVLNVRGRRTRLRLGQAPECELWSRARGRSVVLRSGIRENGSRHPPCLLVGEQTSFFFFLVPLWDFSTPLAPLLLSHPLHLFVGSLCFLVAQVVC